MAHITQVERYVRVTECNGSESSDAVTPSLSLREYFKVQAALKHSKEVSTVVGHLLPNLLRLAPDPPPSWGCSHSTTKPKVQQCVIHIFLLCTLQATQLAANYLYSFSGFII